VEALSSSPTIGLPEIVGGPVFAGCPPLLTTTDVAFEFALADPSAFVAVTLTLSVEPRSADVTLYFVCVAPETGAQLPPLLSQRSQA
jgi:hypothetical protein